MSVVSKPSVRNVDVQTNKSEFQAKSIQWRAKNLLIERMKLAEKKRKGADRADV